MTSTFTVNQMAEEWRQADMTFAAYAAAKHVPLGGTFELTPRCSLKCKMCYVRLDPSQMDEIGCELTAKEWISLAEDAIKAGTVNLLLTGGEPMIRPDFAEIYSALSQMGFIISLNTNATLVTPEIVRLFEKNPPTEIAVTLYGASPETYEKICGDASGYVKTTRGLELLSNLPTELEVRTTFVQDNMEELTQIREIANRYTNRYAINTNVFKPIRGATSEAETCRLSPRQMIYVSESNREYFKQFSTLTDIEQDYQESKNGTDYGFTLPPTILSCLASKASFWITWDGKMLPCGCFSTPYTLPVNEGFISAWNRLPGLLEGILRPKECSKCELNDGSCPSCPAKLQAETDSFDRVSPYICAIAKEQKLVHNHIF